MLLPLVRLRLFLLSPGDYLGEISSRCFSFSYIFCRSPCPPAERSFKEFLQFHKPVFYAFIDVSLLESYKPHTLPLWALQRQSIVFSLGLHWKPSVCFSIFPRFVSLLYFSVLIQVSLRVIQRLLSPSLYAAASDTGTPLPINSWRGGFGYSALYSIPPPSRNLEFQRKSEA